MDSATIFDKITDGDYTKYELRVVESEFGDILTCNDYLNKDVALKDYDEWIADGEKVELWAIDSTEYEVYEPRLIKCYYGEE